MTLPLNQITSRLHSVTSSLEVARLLEALGPGVLYLVGGAVRGAVEGAEVRDLDFGAALPFAQLVERLHSGGLRTILTGEAHGTVTVVIGDKTFELTALRPAPDDDSAARARGNPLLADLLARDFTINAMAYSPDSGELIDPLDGLGDFQANVLRTPAAPDTILRADPLRILRMVRFGPAFGRTLDPALAAAAEPLVPLLGGVAPERIRVELEHILTAPHPRRALELMRDFGIIDLLLPELTASFGFEQNRFHSEDVFSHTLSVVENTPPDLLLRLAALFHDTGKPATLSIDERGDRHFYQHEIVSEQLTKSALTRLRCSNQMVQDVSMLVRFHMRPLECGPSAVRRLMRDLGELLPAWRALKEADKTPTMSYDEFKQQADHFDRLLAAEQEARASAAWKLAINGHDLIDLGMRPGKALGAVLRELEEAVLDSPELNERTELLRRAAELLEARKSTETD